MTVKWKSKTNLKPEFVLQKIESVRSVRDDGGIYFSGFEYHEALAVLIGMVNFPPKCDGLEHGRIVSTAIANIAGVGEIKEQPLIEEINNVVKILLATRFHKYTFLTSLSLAAPAPIKSIVIDGVKVRILASEYPKKYASRYGLLDELGITDNTPNNYAKAIVSLEDRTARGAERRAMNTLDLLRAIWSVDANTGMEVFGGDHWSPINKIRLGEIHTIHRESGKVEENMCWYEPNFKETQPYRPSKTKLFTSNCKWILENIELLPYKRAVIDSLLRYVRALDERDQNLALVKLWAAIEALTIPSGSNYDLLTRRCAFLFDEYDYHQQVLENLREYRNSNVHAGKENDKAKTYCFLLQRYFRQLVLFHLKQVEKFKTLDDANSFLDLPAKKSNLENKKKLIEKAIRFRRY